MTLIRPTRSGNAFDSWVMTAGTVSGDTLTIPANTAEDITVAAYWQNNTAVYSFTIDESNSDESTCVTYGGDCVNFAPIAMNFNTMKCSMGTWSKAFFMPKPCMLHYSDSTHSKSYVDYYLNPNDYTKRADGTASDVTNVSYPGNAMMEFPTVYIKSGKTGSQLTVWVSDTKVDSDYECFSCKKSDGITYASHFYLPIYEGTVTNGALRSISTGLDPTENNTATAEWGYATANNSKGVTTETGYATTMWADEQLMRALGILVFKRLNSQKAIGGGYNNHWDNIYKCGGGNASGLFYGAIDSSTTTVKFFGMENWWYNNWRRSQGIVANNGRIYVNMSLSGIATSGNISDYSSYTDTGFTAPTDYGWITEMAAGKYTLFCPKAVNKNESCNNYYSDYYYYNSGLCGVWFGGSDHVGCTGLSYFRADKVPSYAYFFRSASLSYRDF